MAKIKKILVYKVNRSSSKTDSETIHKASNYKYVNSAVTNFNQKRSPNNSSNI